MLNVSVDMKVDAVSIAATVHQEFATGANMLVVDAQVTIETVATAAERD